MSVTIIFIIIIVAASLYAFNDESVKYKWMLNPYDVNRKGQYYRFITSGLIHGDFMHLLFNLITFYYFGKNVEFFFSNLYGDLGKVLFALLFLLGIIVSDIPTYLKHRNNPGYNSLGASGGVSAIVFTSILFDPLTNLCLYFVICLPGFILGVLYLIYSYFQAKKPGDFINHDAHFYGAVFGVFFAIIVYPPVIVGFFQQVMSWQGFGN